FELIPEISVSLNFGYAFDRHVIKNVRSLNRLLKIWNKSTAGSKNELLTDCFTKINSSTPPGGTMEEEAVFDLSQHI
ncbi:hypothetical protein L9F63_011278, partial [Diploptera punctata]